MMFEEAYIAGQEAALEKLSSTAYSRWLAKSLGGTPKQVTKPLYQEAMERSGKEGREAFRTVKGRVTDLGPNDLRLSRSDPLNRHPDKQRVQGSHGGYISHILRHKSKTRPVHPADAKGTIAKNPRVRQNPIRRSSVSAHGVGDLRVGSAKEMRERARARHRLENMTPEQIEAQRARNRVGTAPPERLKSKRFQSRVENMTPEQIEARRLRVRVENLTPEQIAKKRKAQSDYGKSLREENPDMIKEHDAHRGLLRSLKRKGFILEKKGMEKRALNALKARQMAAERVTLSKG